MSFARRISIAAFIGATLASLTKPGFAAHMVPTAKAPVSNAMLNVPPPRAVASGVPGPMGGGRAAVILYDQYNNAHAPGISSDDFKTSEWNPYDDQAADDFLVPLGKQWSITEIKVSGDYTNDSGGCGTTCGPADWVNVRIYKDAGGLPGAAVYAVNGLVPSAGLASGSFVLDPASAAVLTAGRYWLSVQASIQYVAHGTWRWSDRTVTSNSGAAWRNPLGGFAISACTNWAPRAATCNLDPTAPDQVFQILGTQSVVPPTITGFSPTQGPVGTQVIITGSGFTGATAVTFNGTSATFTVDSNTQITATVPTGATTGPITVTGPGGTGTSTTSFVVTVPPTITGFSPTQGPVGTQVIITGSGFTGATAVRFHGWSAAFTVDSDAQITATVPTGATTGPITVTTPGGTARSATNFGVTPTVTGFSPTQGPVGTQVIIAGRTFTGATAVTFNGTSATFTVDSNRQITATVPTGATTGPITVTGPGGTGTSTTSFVVTLT